MSRLTTIFFLTLRFATAHQYDTLETRTHEYYNCKIIQYFTVVFVSSCFRCTGALLRSVASKRAILLIPYQ